MSFKKIANLFLIMFFIAFSAIVSFHKFKNTPLINGNDSKLKIYEIWHIESFEGGGGNRQNYLNQLSLEYEKQNPTALFMTKRIEAKQLEEALTQNTPDIISFSEEVAKIVLPYLKDFDNEYNIQNNHIESAYYNGKLMALPFIASGYCYFTKTNANENLSIYTANNNLHNATSLINNTINDSQTLSSYECYTKFVNSNNIKLLGTARDLFRIKNLENLGRFNVNYQPVSEFSDLIQYLGKTKNNVEIDGFIDFVMSNSSQSKLANISLFSTIQLNLYSEPTYKEMENALKSCHIPNIFK